MCEQDADYNTELHITLYRFMLHPVNAGLSLSPSAVSRRAKVAATVASFFCVDESSIAYLGHSDGGAMAEGIPVYVSKAGAAPRSVVASAAGTTGQDLAAMPWPSIPAVMSVHSRNDERFPDFGRGAAAYWGRCAACAPTFLTHLPMAAVTSQDVPKDGVSPIAKPPCHTSAGLRLIPQCLISFRGGKAKSLYRVVSFASGARRKVMGRN